MARRFIFLLLLLLPPGASAQQRFRERFPRDSVTPRFQTQPGAVLLASAVLPGAGQKMLGVGRWVPYAALEGWSWITFRHRLREGDDLRHRYRDLAWVVARRVSVGPRRDSIFEYYEAMAKHEASGAFDVDPLTSGTQPETDELTFNGEKWRLARSLFFPSGVDSVVHTNPAYDQALRYYERNAIPASYAWAWGDSELEQRVFAELIHRGDEALRASSRILGVILANHMASAIDAFITARLRESRISPERLQFFNGFVPVSGSLRWFAGVQIAP